MPNGLDDRHTEPPRPSPLEDWGALGARIRRAALVAATVHLAEAGCGQAPIDRMRDARMDGVSE